MAPTPTSARISASSRSSQVVGVDLAPGPDRAQVARPAGPGPCPVGSDRRRAERLDLELDLGLGLGRGDDLGRGDGRDFVDGRPGWLTDEGSGSGSLGGPGGLGTPRQLDVGGGIGRHLARGHRDLAPRPRKRNPTATPPATTATGMAMITATAASDGDHHDRGLHAPF